MTARGPPGTGPCAARLRNWPGSEDEGPLLPRPAGVQHIDNRRPWDNGRSALSLARVWCTSLADTRYDSGQQVNVLTDTETHGATVTRNQANVSTRISAVWTFESGYAGGDATPVPVMAVRFSPALDNTNTAPAGRFTFPLAVEGATGGVTALAVQVSYDEGTTWQPAGLVANRDGWQATVTHPTGAHYVALRVQVTDGHADTVQETIMRAYRIG